MNVTEARNFISGLPDAFTINDLKKAFRKQSFVIHPDRGGTEYEFKFLTKAYDLLKDHASHTLGELSKKLQTIEGNPLSELGNGLPLSISAKECEDCEGQGYKIFFNYTTYINCPSCDGKGAFFLECKKCKGIGDFINSKTGRVVGKCNFCGGSGKFYPIFKPRGSYDSYKLIKLPNGKNRKVNECRRCKGSGNIKTKDENNPTYSKCNKCDGKGEIQIFNPVIPRGFLCNLNE